MSRSPVPTTGSQPIAWIVVTLGPSGATVIVHAGASVCASKRSNGMCRLGNSAMPAASAPHVFGERAGEVSFFGEDVRGAVPESFGLDEDDLCVGRQEIEQDVLALDEPRQPRLHAVERQPFGQSLPLLATPGLAANESVGAPAHLVGRQQLSTGEHGHALQWVGRPLVAHRELAEPVDLIAPEVDPHGGVRSRREEVDDRPADGDLAAMLDEILAAVAGVHELAHELVTVAALPDLDLDGLDLLDVGTEPLGERPDGRDHHIGSPIAVQQPPDRAQAPTHRLDTGAHPLERQGLPRREQVDTIRAEERRQVVGETLAVGGGGHGDEIRPALRGGDETGDRERGERARARR